jgi:hypothetical protein
MAKRTQRKYIGQHFKLVFYQASIKTAAAVADREFLLILKAKKRQSLFNLVVKGHRRSKTAKILWGGKGMWDCKEGGED